MIKVTWAERATLCSTLGVMVHLLCKLTSLLSIIGFANAKSVTYSRGDQNAYLKAGGSGTHKHNPSQIKATRHRLSLEDTPSFNHDDPQECTLYIAESSIPNAGLGIYTTVPYEWNEPIGHSEIGILMHDLHHHYPNGHTSKDLYTHYSWGHFDIADGKFEASGGRDAVLVPGLGMMPNDYPGLTNVFPGTMSALQRFVDEDDTLSMEGLKHETMGDMGRGASSSHSGVKFHAGKYVEAGEELFISYGPGYFMRRKDLAAVPLEEQYKMAEQTLTQFMDRAKQDGLNINSLILQERYDQRIYKAGWLNEKPRVKAALPQNVKDIPAVLEMGAAAFSMMDKKRTVDWVQENGLCMDNLVAGTTSIPQAGRGAFAARVIQKNATIVTTPVITLTLEQLKLRDWKGDFIDKGYQQILNYCYGRNESSLLFFPAAPAVNFINHGSKDESNAELRWSTSPYHQSSWLDIPLNEMKTMTKSGLIFDIVATKEIKRGDEILVYYGESWETHWDKHIQNFGDINTNNFTDVLGMPTVQEMNENEEHFIVRTVSEEETNPYPDRIMTTCYFIPPEKCESPSDVSKGVKCEVQSNTKTVRQRKNWNTCDILSRYNTEDNVHWYTANVTVTTKKQNGQEKPQQEVTKYYLVNYLPRYAIRLVNKPYSTDKYGKGAFRQPIGIGKNMMPEHWMDLRPKVSAQDEL